MQPHQGRRDINPTRQKGRNRVRAASATQLGPMQRYHPPWSDSAGPALSPEAARLHHAWRRRGNAFRVPPSGDVCVHFTVRACEHRPTAETENVNGRRLRQRPPASAVSQLRLQYCHGVRALYGAEAWFPKGRLLSIRVTPRAGSIRRWMASERLVFSRHWATKGGQL
jgi:hypothetical protein